MRSAYRYHRNPPKHDHQEQSFFAGKAKMNVQKKEELTPFFQAKGITIGQSGDQYEQEADSVADALVNGASDTPAIHKKEISSLQRESLATPQDDEKLGTAEQRMEKEKLVQEKPEDAGMEEELEEPAIQTQGEKEEEPEVPMREKEEEEPMAVQAKPEGNGGSVASSSLSSKLESSKGLGKPLQARTRREMESGFGVNFSGVRIHTDGEAVQLNKGLHAQAFTHGKDIYFNTGKFNPDTSTGKHLLAHELTHVVQQTAALKPASKRGGQVLQRRGSEENEEAGAGNGAATGGSSATATSCGKPADCPEEFCSPFSSTFIAESTRTALSPGLLFGIGNQVNPRVVPLWRQYLFGGAAPQDLSAQFGGDFTSSFTTAATTTFLINELKASLKSRPPVFPPGVDMVVVDIPTQIPKAVKKIGTSGDTEEMNFDVIGEIPGNIAGGIGDTQLSCPVGARPSPFNDTRIAKGQAIVSRNPDGSLLVLPFINYTVKDTIDLCPGNCGAFKEMVATIPMSKMEASGISGDVPFTVDFSSMPVAAFTVMPTVPVPVPVPPTLSEGTTTASVLNIRQAPNLSASIIGKYPLGTKVEINCQTTGSAVEGNTTWYQTPKGYISGRYVSLTGGAAVSC